MGDIPSGVASQNFDCKQDLQQKTSGGSSRLSGEAVITLVKLASIMTARAPLESSIVFRGFRGGYR